MAFLRLSNFHIFFVLTIFLYALIVLILNSDRGLDLEDESYYILVASFPSEIFSVITHEKYYTGLLFYLSGYNLFIFRIFGIIILLLSSFWFSLELYSYIEKKFLLNYDFYNKLYFILIILLSSLSYYVWWLLTPSYNWLSLVSMILISSSIFRIFNEANKIKGKLFCLEYLYLGFSLSLLFMAKPSSLIGLFPAFILFILFNNKIDLMRAFFSVSIIFVTLIFFHIIFLDGGFYEYYYKFKEGMQRISLNASGHGIMNSLILIRHDLKNIMISINKYQLLGMLFLILFVSLYLKKLKHKKISLYIYLSVLLFSLSLYYLQIFPYTIKQKVYLLILVFSLFIVCIYFITEESLKRKFKLFIYPFLLLLYLSYLSLALSFGTNTNIWFHASISYIFPVSGLLSFIFILDIRHKLIKNMKIISGIIMSCFVLIIINNAYNNPFGLSSSIKEQTERVDILGGIKVDKNQSIYINDLLKAKDLIKNINENIYLIDTTGATPGSNVILNAKFFDTPWFIGGYNGSNDVVHRILKSIPEEQVKKAWILTTNDGKMSLNHNIFEKLGINFPNEYEKVTDLYLMKRNENQELWKPK